MVGTKEATMRCAGCNQVLEGNIDLYAQKAWHPICLRRHIQGLFCKELPTLAVLTVVVFTYFYL